MFLSLLFVSAAFSATLENLALKTTAPGNGFALCAMDVANAEIIHSNGIVRLLNSELETFSLGQPRIEGKTSAKAALRFYVSEPSARIQIFRLIFRAAEGTRWRMEPVSGEKPFAFTPAAESRARLVADDDYFYLGEIDVAGCR